MPAYYNENDPKTAAWLRELIKADLIAPGDVDERSIEDVYPVDLWGYTQCHFFAGIGGWSYALRLAGWPDSRPVWTGSCPCQPFSQAGKGKGTADERHLWPAWLHLVEHNDPPVIFGEQVASPAGLIWLSSVQNDLEARGFAFGAADLSAASVGAPHIRQRLYWMADTQRGTAKRHGHKVGDPESGAEGATQERQRLWDDSRNGEQSRKLGHADNAGPQRRSERRNGTGERSPWEASMVSCRDGKWRPVEPSTFPLAHGVPGRVGLLRGYGNAIVPQVAATFIRAYEEARAANP